MVTTLSPAPAPTLSPNRPTAAARRAAGNWVANRAALDRSQPRLLDGVGDEAPAVEWLLARDGTLSATDAAGRWLAGCSLPYRAARAMLKTLAANGSAAGFLAPPHAGFVRVALEMSRASQAVVAIVPDPADVRAMLHCEDFSTDIAAGRLWFAQGAGWAAELGHLFDANPGLPTPSQFIRLPLLDDEATAAMVDAAQKAFADVLTRRAERVRALRDAWAAPADGVVRRGCVIAGSDFRLWDDAGELLHGALVRTSPAGLTWERVDPDRPTSAGPLAMAAAAAECDVVLCANAGRADLPDLLPDALPWVTWVTVDRVPAFAGAGPNDALLLADAALRPKATEAGWPAGRVAVGGWPAAQRDDARPDVSAPLALIVDTLDLAPPARLDEFSSHRLLWETIRQHLQADPFAVGDDAGRYLDEQSKRHGVPGEELDRRLFIEGLIHPAFAQGVARAVRAASLPLRLHGRGWDALPEFAGASAGPVESREGLGRAVDGARALIHPLPGGRTHLVDGCGTPVLRAGTMRAGAFIDAARRALKQSTAIVGKDLVLEAKDVVRLAGRTAADAD